MELYRRSSNTKLLLIISKRQFHSSNYSLSNSLPSTKQLNFPPIFNLIIHLISSL